MENNKQNYEISQINQLNLEVFGGCNYTCQMCPQTSPGRGKSFTRKMPLNEFKDILDQIIPKFMTTKNTLNKS